MKCITQMPVVPSDTAARTSQRTRAARWCAYARVVHRSAMNAPRQDMAYAVTGVSAPKAKLWTVSTQAFSPT